LGSSAAGCDDASVLMVLLSKMKKRANASPVF
jgi:hypothetical protein